MKELLFYQIEDRYETFNEVIKNREKKNVKTKKKKAKRERKRNKRKKISKIKIIGSFFDGEDGVSLSCPDSLKSSNLLKKVADMNQCSTKGESPLMIACKENNLKLAKSIIERRPNINDMNKSLNLCSLNGLSDIVSLLIENGANVNFQNNEGQTPLHLAVQHGYVELVEILVRSGADQSLTNKQKKNAFDLTSSISDTTSKVKIINILEDNDPQIKCWKFKIDPKDLVVREQIGEGNFSVCCRGFLYGTPVAIKKIDQINYSPAFNREVGLMGSISHPNILIFLGATDNYIITEYMPMGSLRNYLDKNTIKWQQILKFAMSIGRGMAWLHSRVPVILHCDLHSRNILVTEDLECKVADFGLSQVVGQKDRSLTMYKRIIPPEIFKGQCYTTFSDVFCFGLILEELWTNKKAQNMTSYEFSTIDLSRFANNNDMNIFEDLIKSCRSETPQLRPSFEKILEILETFLYK